MQAFDPIALIMSGVRLAGAGSAAASDDALARAIRRGSDKSIPKLIADGTGINVADDKGRSPLYYAAVRRDGDLIDQLLAKGAVVDAADPAGDTPLIVLMRNTFRRRPSGGDFAGSRREDQRQQSRGSHTTYGGDHSQSRRDRFPLRDGHGQSPARRRRQSRPLR